MLFNPTESSETIDGCVVQSQKRLTPSPVARVHDARYHPDDVYTNHVRSYPFLEELLHLCTLASPAVLSIHESHVGVGLRMFLGTLPRYRNSEFPRRGFTWQGDHASNLKYRDTCKTGTIPCEL